jgi:hypothetical protein
MEQNLVDLIQRYLAVTSVAASAVRGSPTGTAKAAREHLACLDLHRFGTADPVAFQSQLDLTTKELEKKIPAHSWGVARKVLNIFLHNGFYNHYLRDRYQLGLAEESFEVPVDSAVARGLRKEAGTFKLPAWVSVKSLTPEENACYQTAAAIVAKAKGCSRVHLDAVLWVANR